MLGLLEGIEVLEGRGTWVWAMALTLLLPVEKATSSPQLNSIDNKQRSRQGSITRSGAHRATDAGAEADLLQQGDGSRTAHQEQPMALALQVAEPVLQRPWRFLHRNQLLEPSKRSSESPSSKRHCLSESCRLRSSRIGQPLLFKSSRATSVMPREEASLKTILKVRNDPVSPTATYRYEYISII